MTLKLIEAYQRPVIKLADFFGLEALLDTGAVYPIWMNGEETLRQFKTTKVKGPVEFGGLGGMTRGSLYEIPVFQLGGLIYPRMRIIAHRSNFPVPILLPATMFNNLIYEIDNQHHRLNITVPDGESVSRNLTIKDENGRLHVFCSSAE